MPRSIATDLKKFGFTSEGSGAFSCKVSGPGKLEHIILNPGRGAEHEELRPFCMGTAINIYVDQMNAILRDAGERTDGSFIQGISDMKENMVYGTPSVQALVNVPCEAELTVEQSELDAGRSIMREEFAALYRRQVARDGEEILTRTRTITCWRTLISVDESLQRSLRVVAGKLQRGRH